MDMMVSIVLRLLQFQLLHVGTLFFFFFIHVIMQIEGHESTKNVSPIKYF